METHILIDNVEEENSTMLGVQKFEYDVPKFKVEGQYNVQKFKVEGEEQVLLDDQESEGNEYENDLQKDGSEQGMTVYMDEHEQNTIIIEEVRKYAHLYDVRRPDYKDAAKKEQTWAAIAAVIQADPNAVKKRWKNLRDTFARKLREAKRLKRLGGTTAPRAERWPYLGMLGFLQNVVKTRASYCSVMCNNKPTPLIVDVPNIRPSDGKGDETDNSHNLKCELAGGEIRVPSVSSAYDSGFGESQEQIDSSMLHPYSLQDSGASKPDCNSEPSSNQQSRDAASSFGTYVAAEMRDLPRHQQQWARFKISEILYQATTIPPTGQ